MRALAHLHQRGLREQTRVSTAPRLHVNTGDGWSVNGTGFTDNDHGRYLFLRFPP
jgi:hypothetical protein